MLVLCMPGPAHCHSCVVPALPCPGGGVRERPVWRHAGRGQSRGETAGAGDYCDRGRRWRGDLLRGVPGGLRGRRRAEDGAVRAHVPRGCIVDWLSVRSFCQVEEEDAAGQHPQAQAWDR